MATKKDLVEAYSFSRRRLVTAFLSGAPGGREVEPSRPGRTVVGGLALAVLLVAGAAIASVLASRTEEDWNQVGLVVSRQEAAPYVILSEGSPPTLIPVINITSAQLILGADVGPTYVDQDVIEDQTPGEPIGIAGAPQTLPRPHQFIESGWTACTDDGLGIAVDVAEEQKVTVPDGGGVVVESGEAYWVISRSGELDLDQRRAHRYLLPEGSQSELLLDALGLDNKAEAPTVPEEWLNLFPEGGELSLASFEIEEFGQPLDVPELPAQAKVGDYVLDESGEEGVYLTADGRAAPLDRFALQVYETSSLPGQPDQVPGKLDIDLPPIPSAERSYEDAHWPDQLLDPVRGQVCAQLDARHDDVPLVDLAAEPTGAASVDDDVLPGTKTVSIDRGRGAFVRVGTWDETTSTSAYVIDPRGQAYALVGGETVAKLGYAGSDESFIPDGWLKLFTQGVSLSTSKALCPPVIPDQPSDEEPEEAASAAPDPDGGPPQGCQEFDG
jgi:type VII secretion protein EccB